MKKDTLVVYFSCGGTTEWAGKTLAGILGCGSYPLEAQESYTKEDLDWRNPDSRSSLEMKDEGARPAYKKLPVDLEDYGRIFIGFPIWWDIEPRIIDHFLEEEDLKGKEVVPFATSGGSPIDKAQDRLEGKYGPGLKILRGQRLNRSLEKEDVEAWIQDLTPEK